MDKPANLDLREMEGVRHCHGENCDEYDCRPVVTGNDLFTYVAHIPPGGGVPSEEEESSMYEMSLYVLSGHTRVIYGDEEFSMSPHTGLHPLGRQ